MVRQSGGAAYSTSVDKFAREGEFSSTKSSSETPLNSMRVSEIGQRYCYLRRLLAADVKLHFETRVWGGHDARMQVQLNAT